MDQTSVDTPHLVLLNLDPTRPLRCDILDDLVRYIQIFFCCDVQIKDVPPAPKKKGGWESLEDRLWLPFKTRPGRPDCEKSGGGVQFLVPQLMDCIEYIKMHPEATHGIPVDGAEVILCLTANELLMDEAGLLPREPAPEERTRKRFVRSRELPVGAVTFAHVNQDEQKGLGLTSRHALRKLMKFLTHSLTDLLGLRTCQYRECLAFLRPFDPKKTPLFMCARCEDALVKRTRQPIGIEDAVQIAGARFKELQQFFHEKNEKLPDLKLGYRSYLEFEEETDWLRNAEEILQNVAMERHTFVDAAGATRHRRRSLLNCLLQVHDRQPPSWVSQRTHSEPLLKRACLVDMTMSSPFRHEQGELKKWATAVHNKKHATGGFFVEAGGSLLGKKVGMFVDSGLRNRERPGTVNSTLSTSTGFTRPNTVGGASATQKGAREFSMSATKSLPIL